jgi:hypothetical protein
MDGLRNENGLRNYQSDKLNDNLIFSDAIETRKGEMYRQKAARWALKRPLPWAAVARGEAANADFVVSFGANFFEDGAQELHVTHRVHRKTHEQAARQHNAHLPKEGCTDNSEQTINDWRATLINEELSICSVNG